MEINHFYPPIGLQHQCFTVTKHTKRHDYHVYNYNRGRFMEKNNKLMQKNIKYFFNSQFYPKNVVQPQCRGRSKMTLNTINECIIITHAHGFVPVKKYWDDGCLAAPYSASNASIEHTSYTATCHLNKQTITNILFNIFRFS